MKRVIVTVKRKGEARVQDLELPANVPVGEFLHEMTEVLGWEPDAGFSLQAYGPHSPENGEPIAETQTLQEAGVRDGFWLVAVLEPGMVRRYQPPKPIYASAKSSEEPPASVSDPKPPPSGAKRAAGTPAPGSPRVKWVNLMPESMDEQPPGEDEETDDDDNGWTLREIDDLD